MKNLKNLPLAAKIAISILLVLVVFRLFLPRIVLKYVNIQLNHLESYQGHVDDIDISLIRGAYKIQGLSLLKRNGAVPIPFIAFREADISVEWKALFDGSLVAEVGLREPSINFVDGPTKAESQTEMDSDWRDIVKNLIPLKINRLTVKEGEIHFRNLKSEPPVDIYLDDVEIVAKNLSNSKDIKENLPASVNLQAIAMKEAPLKFDMKMNALKNPMDFDYNAELTGLTLSKLNAFLSHYASLDVERGQLSLASEMAMKDGKIAGYFKPSVKDMKVVKASKDLKKGPFSLIWQSIAGTLGDVFQNDDRQSVKIPIEGTIDHPETDTWAAIGSVFSHAFGSPLKPGTDNSIDLNSAKNQEVSKSEDKDGTGKDEKSDKKAAKKSNKKSGKKNW